MANERPSAFEVTQIGVEATPGTAVDALKRLLCTSFMFDPQNIGAEPYTPQGYLVPTTGSKQKEFVNGTYEGRACFNDMCYLLSGLLGAPTITTPGGATNTRRWKWTPKSSGPNPPKVFTVEKGSVASGFSERATHVLINGMTFRITQEEAAVSGSIIGQEPDYDVRMSKNEIQTVDTGGASSGTFTLTLSGQTTGDLAFNITASNLQTALEGLSNVGAGNVLVTAVSSGVYRVEFVGAKAQTNLALMTISGSDSGWMDAEVVLVQDGAAVTEIPEKTMDTGNVSIWTGPDVAGLARLKRVKEVELSIDGRYVPQFTLDDQEPSFSTSVEQAFVPTANIVMQRDADAKALVGYLRAKTTRVWRIQVLGPLIEGSFYHAIRITFPEKGRSVGHGDVDSIATGAFDLFLCHDATFGGWIDVEIDCLLTAL